MAKIAIQEEVGSMRQQEDTDLVDKPDEDSKEAVHAHRKCIASVKGLHEAFESIHTLRYSQPTHLQGKAKFLDEPINVC